MKKQEKVRVYYMDGKSKPEIDPRHQARGFYPDTFYNGRTAREDNFKPGKSVDPKVQINHPYTGKPMTGNDFQSERGMAQELGRDISEHWQIEYPEVRRAGQIAVAAEQTETPSRLGHLTLIVGGAMEVPQPEEYEQVVAVMPRVAVQ